MCVHLFPFVTETTAGAAPLRVTPALGLCPPAHGLQDSSRRRIASAADNRAGGKKLAKKAAETQPAAIRSARLDIGWTDAPQAVEGFLYVDFLPNAEAPGA
jgi:hypothetical protein